MESTTPMKEDGRGSSANVIKPSTMTPPEMKLNDSKQDDSRGRELGSDSNRNRSSIDNSPLKKLATAIPITPSKVSVKSDQSIDERLDTPYMDPPDLLGLSSTNSSVTKNTPRSARRKSFGRESSSKSRRNSNQISPTSMIFRNLLIMEEDLRNQAREQKKLRWQYTGFLSCLAGAAAFSIYELYFSEVVVKGIYRFFLQFTICFISITLVLFHLSGQYKRTIVIPRRFFVSTNKGIRQFNIRLVKVHSTWDENLTDMIRLAMNAFSDSNIWLCEEILTFWKPIILLRFWHGVKLRCQPRIGAVDVKIVLNPRAFSAEIREGWEIYRDEFWAREGARRRKTVNEAKS